MLQARWASFLCYPLALGDPCILLCLILHLGSHVDLAADLAERADSEHPTWSEVTKQPPRSSGAGLQHYVKIFLQDIQDPLNSQQCGKHKLGPNHPKSFCFFGFYMNLPSFLMSLINIEVFQLNATILYMQDPAHISLQTRSRPPGHVGQSPSVRIDRPNDHASPAHAAYKV